MENHKLPDDDKHRGYAINAINGTLVGASLVLVCLRVVVRTKITHNFGWDDSLIILALVTAIIVFGMAAESVHQGIGRHVVYLHPQQVAEAVKWNRVGLLPLVLSQMLTKLSICVFLYRIFGLKKKWKWAIYPIALLNVAGAVAALVVVLAECSPVTKFWNQTIQGSCWPRYIGLRIVIFQGASSAFCDFALAFLPVVFLWNMHIKKSLKFGIGGLMGLGVFTGICAIVRTAYLAEEPQFDWTYFILDITIWFLLEMDIGIIVACVPTIRPLFQKEFVERICRCLGMHNSELSRPGSQQPEPTCLRISENPWDAHIMTPSTLESQVSCPGCGCYLSLDSAGIAHEKICRRCSSRTIENDSRAPSSTP